MLCVTSVIAFSYGYFDARRYVVQPFSSQVAKPLSPFTCTLRKRMSLEFAMRTAVTAGLMERVTR